MSATESEILSVCASAVGPKQGIGMLCLRPWRLSVITRRLYDEKPRPTRGSKRASRFHPNGYEASDYNAIRDLLATPVDKPRVFFADRGLYSEFLREELLIHGIRPLIRQKQTGRTHLPACDFRAYKHWTASSGYSTQRPPQKVPSRCDPILQTRKSFSTFLALAVAKDLRACALSPQLTLIPCHP